MSLACPICQTTYAIGFEGRVDGSVCGDESQDQERPCVGRLIPWDAMKAAEWRDRIDVKNELAFLFRTLRELDHAASGQLPSCKWRAVPPSDGRCWGVMSGNLLVAIVKAGSTAEADAKIIAGARNAIGMLFQHATTLEQDYGRE